MSTGANIDLSAIHTTVHVGAHTDAPSHYTLGGEGIGERALELYLGRCQVVSVQVRPGERVRCAHLPRPIEAPRVLFHTATFPDSNRFSRDFAGLSAELVEAVHDAGGVLIGIDTPSIDPFDDVILEAHQAVARRNMAILEGIVLTGISDGIYTLVALPLRIPGADASPVRAVLVEDAPPDYALPAL